MNLKSLDGKTLLQKTHALVAEERRITLELMDHLREIERRMLFLEMGYGSLFEFCTKHLGLSEGSAQRRISAMRLVRDVSGVKERLASGDLSLSNAAKLQSVFRTDKKSDAPLNPDQKREVIAQVSGLSQRECEARLLGLMPEAVKAITSERVRVVDEGSFELKLILPRELHEKLMRLKDLLAHQYPDGKILDLLVHLADQELSRLEKKKAGVPEQARSTGTATAAAVRTEKVRSSKQKRDVLRPVKSISSAEMRRQVWRRAQGQCEFSNCSSRHMLEMDHRIPRALGGTDSLENLRLLCRMHNLQQAKEKLGTRVVSEYVSWIG